MIDALTSLAFSMHSAKGVYALLLGSGISRSAKIPTGWEITMELVKKAAAAQSVTLTSDQAADEWHRTRYGEGPDYSKLLDGLARTPAERQQALRAYIEPDKSERERGDKLPTEAHRAIARLVAAGVVRVIVTTNFDQLLESALRDVGVSPTVIASSDDVVGAVPLVHAGCTIIKVHGDYMDTRIRNTPSELAQYEPALDKLLDQVFDEFGLVICGWSGDWDVALKNAITRASARRYSMYWAARGAPSAAAADLVAHRRGQAIAIKGADEFFDELAEKVAALDAFDAPHPLSADLAVAMLEDYSSEDRHRIRYSNLVDAELDRLLAAMEEPVFARNEYTEEILTSQLAAFVSATSILTAMAFSAGRWAKLEQVAPWVRAVAALGNRPIKGGYTDLAELARLPAMLVVSAFGLGAVAAGNVDSFATLASSGGFEYQGTPACAADRFNAATLFTDDDVIKRVAQYKSRIFGMADWLFDTLRPVAKRILRDDSAYERAFVSLEIVLAAGFAERISRPRMAAGFPHFWTPHGRYVYAWRHRQAVLDQWRASVAADAGSAPLSRMAGLRGEPDLTEIEAFAKGLDRFG